jgi:C4-dicarboxylate-specific signal transduction histidine kinase
MADRVILCAADRDAAAIRRVLAAACVSCETASAQATVAHIAGGEADLVILTATSLASLRAAGIEAALERQPLWSDIPVVVLARADADRDAPALPGNTTLLRRPVRLATIVDIVRTQLRARTRQRAVAHHLADRTQAEADLHRRAARLEERLQAEAHELTSVNGRLFDEMLARIDERERMNRMQAELFHVSRISALETMASVLAHELNQPLTAVMNYVRGVRRLLANTTPPASDDVLDALDTAVRSAQHAGEIVRHVRDLVRFDDVKRVPTDLPSVVRDALTIGLIDAVALGITHVVTLDPTATSVVADAIQIQQVLINLIRNSVEAMKDSDVREVTVASRRCGATMVEVIVADRGPGLPATIADTLFSPFRTTKPQGMGIGLSISRDIVEAHGGTIAGGDRAGGGAEFCFRLPLAPSGRAARIPASARSDDPPA